MPESADKLFQNFVKAESYIDTKEQFTKLCNEVELNPDTDSVFYTKLKQRLVNHPHYAKLWKLIDQRRLNDEYMMGTACKGRQVLVIGAGPCGLRMAIECAFLGARVTVLEAREYFSRNNVLYLWRYVKTDLKALGVKIFSPQFCTGGLDHISIRALQLFLLKISLLLGVKIYCPLKFVDLVQPAHGNGWRVKVDQPDHPVSEVDFDVIVGGEGKRHTLAGYSHKTLRGRLAIAVTANIVNARTKRDVKARELGGLSLIFDQEFFKCLAGESGVDLENFVYFKSDTHYFVMTIKKKGLLKQGILLEDKPNDAAALLARNNVNWDKLKDLSRNIIDVATERKLEGVPFAKNHHGQDDLAIFDFTSMRQAQNSCFAQKINGKKLLTCIVGDALLEPFWPQGTGCARGFLGVFDGAWLIRNWCQGEDPVKCIAEREAIFSLLSQTKNEALKPKYAKYTIDPKSRYHSIPAPQVAHASRLYVEDNVVRPSRPLSPQPSRKREAEKSRDTKSLLQWYKNKLKRFENIAPIKDLNESWKSGVALLSVVQLYRPDLIDISVIDENAAHDNCRQALILIEQEFGVTPSLKAEEICGEKMNKWALLTYLALLQERLAAEVPLKKKRGAAALSADSIASDPGASNMEDVENYLAKSLSAFRVLKTLTQSTKKATLERAAERQAVWSNSLSRSAKKKDKGLAKLKNSILLSSTLRRSKSKPLQSIIDSVHMKTSSLKRNKSQPNPKVSEAPQDEYKPRGQTFTAANEAPPATDITKPSPSEDSPKFSVRFQSPKGSPRDSPVSKESPRSSPPPDSDSGSEEVKLDYTKSLARQACKGKASNLIAMFQKGNPPSEDIIKEENEMENVEDTDILMQNKQENIEDENKRISKIENADRTNETIQEEENNPIGEALGKEDRGDDTSNGEYQFDRKEVGKSDADEMTKHFDVSAEDINGDVITDIKNGEVTADDKNGVVTADDKNGDVKADDKNGDVKAEDKNGDVIANDKNGDITADDNTEDHVADHEDKQIANIERGDTSSNTNKVADENTETQTNNHVGDTPNCTNEGAESSDMQSDKRQAENTEEASIVLQQDANLSSESDIGETKDVFDEKYGIVNNNDLQEPSYEATTDLLDEIKPDHENTEGISPGSDQNGKLRVQADETAEKTISSTQSDGENNPELPVCTEIPEFGDSAGRNRAISDRNTEHYNEIIDITNKNPEPTGLKVQYLTIHDAIQKSMSSMKCSISHQGSVWDYDTNLSTEIQKMIFDNISSITQINEEDADSESEEEEVANMCYICDKILFVVNRVSAHGKYFHRDCFKCATCDTHLRVGDSFELKGASEKVQLYCQTHYFMSGAQGVSNELLSRSMKRLKLSDVTEGDTSTDQSIRLPPEITITEPADEETSSEDEVDLDSLVAKNMGIDSPTKPRKHVMFSDSSVDSSDDSDSEDELDVQRDARMLIADEIQQGLEEVEEEEEELQERGVKLEKKLVQGDEDQQVVNEWLAISVKQNKLKEKASKLMLKKKLMELTDMINRCQLEYLELVDDDDEDELQLKTDAIDKDIQELTGQMKSVKMFLNRGESAS